MIYGNPNGIKIGTWTRHGDHGVVDTMDPCGDGDVMASYKVRVTRVCFTCRPLRGMLLEWAWGGRMARWKGDLGGDGFRV